MSTLRSILGDMWALLFPPVCPVCGCDLLDGEHFICTACRFRAPLTGFCNEAANPMTERLAALLPVERASAFIYYAAGSDWRRLIHSFKYHGKWRYAREMGVWYGHALRQSGLYGDVDVIVPVPLHFRKRMKRGYNQSEYIADGIASVLGVEVDRRSIYRRVNNPSQTLGERNDRWTNVDGVFAVRRPEALRGRHVLVVDDVFTTGATVISCGEAILRTVDDVRLSVATLAVSQNELALDR